MEVLLMWQKIQDMLIFSKTFDQQTQWNQRQSIYCFSIENSSSHESIVSQGPK